MEATLSTNTTPVGNGDPSLPGVDTASSAIITARTTGAPIMPPLIESRDAALAVAERVAIARGGIGGWKVGTMPDGTTMCAPFAAVDILATPAMMPTTCLAQPGVEGEIAFRLGRSISAGAAMPDDAVLRAAIASAHPVIELVDSRYIGWNSASSDQLIADGLLGGVLVIGEAIPDWHAADLIAPGLTMAADGVEIGPASRNHTDPLALLAMLVAHCRGRGVDLPAGTYVTTGSVTGIAFVDRAATITLRQRDRIVARIDPSPEAAQ